MSGCGGKTWDRDLSPGAQVLRYISLPEKLVKGTYDAYGNSVSPKDPAAISLVLYDLPGEPFQPWQCWGVFDDVLEPGQFGQLTFLNAKGQAVPGGAFTQWDRETAMPFFGDDLLTLYSVSRAANRARIIGRNACNRPVHAAAGLLFVEPPPAQPERGKSNRGRRKAKKT